MISVFSRGRGGPRRPPMAMGRGGMGMGMPYPGPGFSSPGMMAPQSGNGMLPHSPWRPTTRPVSNSSTYHARPPFDLILSEPAFPRVQEIDDSQFTQVSCLILSVFLIFVNLLF